MLKGIVLSSSVVAAGVALLGCNQGKKLGDRERNPGQQQQQQQPPPGGGNPPATPPARLSPTDPGVQTGLQLLRGEITAAQAVTAWQADGITPAQALDLVGRLPLTAGAPGAGVTNVPAAIVDGFGRTTDLTVSVPAAAPPAEGHPVVVFLHGLGGDSSSVADVAQVLPDYLVVGPSAQDPPASVTYEDSPPAPIPAFAAFPHWWVYRDHAFATKVLDWVRERYAVNGDRVVIFGVSMGGFGAWNVGLRFHDRFAALVTGAGGISRLEYFAGTTPDATSRALLANAAMIPTWFAHGDQDTIVGVEHSRRTDADLTTAGIGHTYTELAGAGHDNSSFLGNPALMAALTAWLSNRTREASPATVNHRAIGDYHLGAYWVELHGPGGSVQATCDTTSVTVTTAGGATGATVYLDPTLVDVTGTVTVTVDGNAVFQGVPAASLDAVARSFARTRDPRLTYAHMVSTP